MIFSCEVWFKGLMFNGLGLHGQRFASKRHPSLVHTCFFWFITIVVCVIISRSDRGVHAEDAAQVF